MKLPQFLNRKTYGSERPRAPQAILHIPPGGAAVHCQSVEKAQEVAQQWAAENPGKTAAVYALVGYAFRPIETPEFVPATSDKAKEDLLDCTPGSSMDWDDGVAGGDTAPERPDLSPEQREQLARHRTAMHDSREYGDE